jgi:hypothetical protein
MESEPLCSFYLIHQTAQDSWASNLKKKNQLPQDSRWVQPPAVWPPIIKSSQMRPTHAAGSVCAWSTHLDPWFPVYTSRKNDHSVQLDFEMIYHTLIKYCNKLMLQRNTCVLSRLLFVCKSFFQLVFIIFRMFTHLLNHLNCSLNVSKFLTLLTWSFVLFLGSCLLSTPLLHLHLFPDALSAALICQNVWLNWVYRCLCVPIPTSTYFLGCRTCWCLGIGKRQ